MTITFMVYNMGFPFIREAKTSKVDFQGENAIFQDEDGIKITIEKDDVLSIEAC